MSTPPKRPEWLLPLLGLLVFLTAAVVFAVFAGPRSDHPVAPVSHAGPKSIPPGPHGTSGVSGLPDANSKVALEVSKARAVPSLWIDVAQPAKVRDALFSNEWAQDVLKHPLGRGFAGPWAPFLGSKGEDLKASFSGTVLSLFADQLLAGPFRVVWFSGGSDGGPVLVIPDPGTGAQTAFGALDQVARRGSYTATQCPGGGEAPGGGVEVARWLIAEHAVFGAVGQGRMVLGRTPSAVLEGLCAELPGMAREGADLELAFTTEQLGHGEAELASALGLGKVARLQLMADKSTLVPKGLAAEVVTPGRLDAAPLSDELLRAIPEDTAVLLTLQLKLPEELDAKSLQGYWKDGKAAKVATRQVALLWNPRGDTNQPMELAVLWSRKEDAPALGALFSGPRHLASEVVCHQQALASSAQMLQRLEAACAGRTPNVLNAAPSVVAGLRAPASVGLGVHLGHLLPQLALDGYGSDSEAKVKTAAPNAPPPEIDEARRELEALPFLGFSGTAQERTWTPGGFRS